MLPRNFGLDDESQLHTIFCIIETSILPPAHSNGLPFDDTDKPESQVISNFVVVWVL